MDNETACNIIEACDLSVDPPLYTTAARYLAQRVRKTENVCTERDTLARELAELEHTHDQLCTAAVALADECASLKRRLDASQKELLRALAEAEGADVLSRSASDEPLEKVSHAGAHVYHPFDEPCDETTPPIAVGQRWRWRAGGSGDVWEIVHWDANKDDWEVTVSGPVSAKICTRQTLPWELFHETWELCEFALASVPLEELQETAAVEAAAENAEVEAEADAALNGDFVVSEEEFAALQDILENPPPPTPALIALMQKIPATEDPPASNQGKKKKKRDAQ